MVSRVQSLLSSQMTQQCTYKTRFQLEHGGPNCWTSVGIVLWGALARDFVLSQQEKRYSVEQTWPGCREMQEESQECWWGHIAVCA